MQRRLERDRCLISASAISCFDSYSGPDALLLRKEYGGNFLSCLLGGLTATCRRLLRALRERVAIPLAATRLVAIQCACLVCPA